MMRLRQKLHISLHRLLMPLAVSIALGGLLSMIGSAGNIIGNTTLAARHLKPIPLFAITPLGVVLVVAGFAFMKWWGMRHLPSNGKDGEFLTDYQEVKSYLSEIRVSPSSTLVGASLRSIGYFREHNIMVLRIFREGGTVISPKPQDIIQAQDRLLVQGNTEAP